MNEEGGSRTRENLERRETHMIVVVFMKQEKFKLFEMEALDVKGGSVFEHETWVSVGEILYEVCET